MRKQNNDNKLLPKTFRSGLSLTFPSTFFFCSFALIWLIPSANSTVDFNMVSIRKKKELLSQLNNSDADIMIGQSYHEARTESRANAVDRDTSLNKTNGSFQISGSQVDMHTLEQNFF